MGDPPLLAVVVVLTAFGVAMVYSAGQVDVPNAPVADVWKAQIVWVLLGLATLLVVVRVPAQWYEWIAIPAYVVGVAALLLTLAIGVGRGTAEGTRSWIQLGPVAVQPSQFMNIATILILARVLGSRREQIASLKDLILPVILAGVPIVLVMMQPDLGTAMVLGAVFVATLYWSGAPLGLLFMLLSPVLALFLSVSTWLFSVYMLGLVAFLYFYRPYLWESLTVGAVNLVAGTVAIPLWNSLEQYQKNRLLVFLDPSLDPRGAGYQLIQSQVAIGSGGITGKGFGEGTQKSLAFLPEQHTDFIFSVIGEELGFVGTVGVLAVFMFILWRLVRIAEHSSDPFAAIAVFGIFGAWFAHVFVNVGMTIGLMPITGIPLPFISYGGSFMLASFIALAIAERVAAEQSRYAL